MKIYFRAYPLLIGIGLLFLIVNICCFCSSTLVVFNYILLAASLLVYILVVRFFRIPKRPISKDSNLLVSPADGTIVAIEKEYEDEFLKADCLKVSIFMSVFDVHQNRIPTSGQVIYSKYHKGKYLVAWSPKSSLNNERDSIAIERADGVRVLIRQIAGFVAHRIICGVKQGDAVEQGDELGFIMFGSRVDIYLPLSFKPTIALNDKVKGNISIIGQF
ncbi:MAG: phosphatidylserine decarboxylase family protein [Bacteroidales bacterium]